MDRHVAFISVRMAERASVDQLEAKLAKLPEVQEVHCVAGEDRYLMKETTRIPIGPDVAHAAQLPVRR